MYLLVCNLRAPCTIPMSLLVCNLRAPCTVPIYLSVCNLTAPCTIPIYLSVCNLRAPCTIPIYLSVCNLRAPHTVPIYLLVCNLRAACTIFIGPSSDSPFHYSCSSRSIDHSWQIPYHFYVGERCCVFLCVWMLFMIQSNLICCWKFGFNLV